MGTLGEPIHPPGTPMTPLQVVKGLRWLGDLDSRDIVDAIRAAADTDLENQWPELSPDEVADMRQLCHAMTKNRLRTWTRSTLERQPTWLEVRALITGLHATLR